MSDKGTISSPARVGVDGYNLALARGTGVATYGRTLCRAVKAMGSALDLFYGVTVSAKSSSEMREALFYSRLATDADPPKLNAFSRLRSYVAGKYPHPFPRHMLEIPQSENLMVSDLADQVPPHDRLFTRSGLFRISAGYFRRYGRFMPIRVDNPPQIMHWTYPVPVVLEGARNIYTLHDLVPLRLPHTSLEDKAFYRSLIAKCIRVSDHICTVSDASRGDILELFDASPDKVTNTHQPVDLPRDAHAPADLAHSIERLFGLSANGYFLFFGAIEPKKNLGRLVEAYLISGITTPLVIVGPNGWRSDGELRLLHSEHGRKLQQSGSIRRIDYLPRELLVRLVQGARAVTFPSLSEGFGLPALETLALGVPLLAANTSSLPEVVGSAACLVDPYDTAQIAATLRELDTDAALRNRLSVAGPAQAGKFNAIEYMERVRQMYMKTLGSRDDLII